MDDRFRAIVGDAEADVPHWLTTPPQAIRYRPVRRGEPLATRRVAVNLRGTGLRTDLRAIDTQGDDVVIADERDWYRNPSKPRAFLIEHPRVLVEELVPIPDPLPEPMAPAEGSPWPLRLPVRITGAEGSPIGRRAIVRFRLREGRGWEDQRDFRVCSSVVPSMLDPDSDAVQVVEEAAWYEGWDSPSTGSASNYAALAVWLE